MCCVCRENVRYSSSVSQFVSMALFSRFHVSLSVAQIAYNFRTKSKTIDVNLSRPVAGLVDTSKFPFYINGKADWHGSCMTKTSQESVHEQSRSNRHRFRFQDLWQHHRGACHKPQDTGRKLLLPAWSFGLRQDLDTANDRRPRKHFKRRCQAW
ncbi:conserved hypothetical protein [Agrobacterium fabacearum CFBP 5771]|nr:conserved hypothetical protein [Agrobacterium fabacearum CFBP 5771]